MRILTAFITIALFTGCSTVTGTGRLKREIKELEATVVQQKQTISDQETQLKEKDASIEELKERISMFDPFHK